MTFEKSLDSKALNDLISNTPGVIEHGIFYGLTDAIFIAANGVINERWA
jgi:ribose 5-phosphate isomerase A